MNRFLLALSSVFLFIGFQAAAQQVLRFEKAASSAYDLHESFKNYRVLALTDGVGSLADGETLTVRTDKGKFSFTLRDSKIFAPNYIVSVRGAQGVERQSLQELGFTGAYFTNDQVLATEALVLSVFDNQYSIFLKQGTAEWHAEPLSAYIPSAPRHLYVQYRAEDVAAVDAYCGNAPLASGAQQNPRADGPGTGACFNAELAIGCDYSLFQKYGSVAATINRTAMIANLSRADYRIANGLQGDIGFQLVEHYIVACATCDPWPVTTDVSLNLTNIRLNGPTLFRNNYDLAQWWFNPSTFSGGKVGMAYVGALCGSYRYNTIMDFSANTATMRSANSHQLGHNFNCSHDAAGSGTIMAPAVGGHGAWSALSVSEIGVYAPTAACLTACPKPAASTLIVGKPTSLAPTVQAFGGLTVYPNPVRETIFISGLKHGDEIRVLNNLGRVVAQRVAAAASEEIDVRRWTAGVYLVQVGDVAVRVVRE